MSDYFSEADPGRVVSEYPLGSAFEQNIVSLSVDALKDLQTRRFLRVVKRAWEIPFYARRWRAAGLEPGAIKTLDDVALIPAFTKSDLMQSVAEHPPFGDFHGMDDLAGEARRQVIFHTTSGTTGDPQPLIFGAFDREVQNVLLARTYRMHGLRDDDIVHSVYGFGMVNGGHYVREAVTHFTRALMLTPGTGADMPSEQQVRLMAHFGVTVLVGFADYLLRLAEVARGLGLEPGRDLKVRMLSGHIPADRAQALSAEWGGVPVHDWYGVGDTGVVAAACPGIEGLVVYEDAHLLELLDPDTGNTVAPGASGNQCVTVLFKDCVYPIIRFDTQDITAWGDEMLGPLRCTRGFLGRSDNMVKLRGINVYPTAIAGLLQRWPHANGEYVCIVRRTDGREEMSIKVEWKGALDGDAQDHVSVGLSEALGVRVDAQLCAPASTAELTQVNARQKPKRLVDQRND